MKKTLFFILTNIFFIFSVQIALANPGQAYNDSTDISAPAPYGLTDINYEIEQTQKKLKKMQYALASDALVIKIDTALKKYTGFLVMQSDEFNEYNPNNLSKFFLENTYRLWVGYSSKLQGWRTEIKDRIFISQDNIDYLDKLKQIWGLTYDNENNKEDPSELIVRISSVIEDIEESRKGFVQKKRDLILIEDGISEMITFNNNIIEEVSQLQQHLRDSLFIAVSEPLWKLNVDKTDYLPVRPRLKKVWHENSKTMVNYLKTINLSPFFIVVVFIFLLFFFMRKKYMKIERDNSDPGYKQILRTLINRPALTLTSIVLITYHLMFPYYPLIVAQILTLVLLVNMRYILSGFIDNDDKAFITILIILLILNDAEIIFWYFGDVARFYILIETIIGLALLYKFVSLKKLVGFKKLDLRKQAVGILAHISFLFYFISLFANVFGFLNLSVLLIKVGSHAPEFTVILYGVSIITKTVVRAYIQIGIASGYKAMEKYWGIIEKRSIKVINLLAYFYWMLFLLISFEVVRPVESWLSDFFEKERAIGTIDISLGNILSFIIILIVTFSITAFIKVFVEKEVLDRLKLPKGIPATISVTIRYFIIVLGIVFAMSSAGIELGKVSLLAGALGIGIGFGLQNI
ncbi:MAG: hypothetical protein DRJ05_11495, partial [Bacteroidetes bacterium]